MLLSGKVKWSAHENSDLYRPCLYDLSSLFYYVLFKNTFAPPDMVALADISSSCFQLRSVNLSKLFREILKGKVTGLGEFYCICTFLKRIIV